MHFTAISGLIYWTNSVYNQHVGRSETRRLIVNQNGLTLSGSYRHPEGNSSRITGRLLGERGIELVLDGGGITFAGELNFLISGSFCCRPSMNLIIRGGSADGMTLRFDQIDNSD